MAMRDVLCPTRRSEEYMYLNIFPSMYDNYVCIDIHSNLELAWEPGLDYTKRFQLRVSVTCSRMT